MTDVAVTRSTQTAKPAARNPHRAQPATEDVRAMNDAFARARGDDQPPVGKLLQQGGRMPQGERKAATPLAHTAAEFRSELAQAAGLRAADERGSLDRREAEKGGEQVLAQVSPNQPAPQGAAPLPAPSPHVDPSGFAQMLADLWTRENGRGDRRVQVRFGAEAWPATGALLVQSADGMLDVTIDMAPGSAEAPRSALAAAFSEAGLKVGRVETQSAVA